MPPAPAPAKVIVCDDHALVRQTVSAVLATEGYEVEGAASAEEFLRAADRIHPDLVIMDMRLGDDSGLAAIDELRARPELAETPVLLLSGETLEGVSDLKRRTKADAFLVKPFEIDEFVERVRQLVDARRGG